MNKQMPQCKNRSILFILPSLGKGGAQRATISLANTLASTRMDLDVTILAIKKDEIEFDIDTRINLITLNENSFRRSLNKIRNVIKSGEYTIIHSALWHINFITWLILRTIFAKNKPKHIHSIHNNPDWIIKTENKYLAYTYYNLVLKLAKNIMTVSNGIKDHLIQHQKTSPSSVTCIYNPAISNNHILQIQENLNDTFVEEHSGKYLLWVGRLDYQKNVTLFIETIKLTKTPAIIIGEGPEEKSLKQTINDLGLNALVKVLPFQKNVMYYMRNSFLFLLTSRFEGFGLVLVEALYSETPVLSTNCDYGPSEIIIEGKNGFILDSKPSSFAEKISLLQTNHQLYEELKKNTRHTITKFYSDTIGAQYLQTYL